MNWYCNASYQFYLIQEIAPSYNICLVPEKFRLADYRRVGANPIYCQEAANPNIYRPYPLPETYDITFVGQKYGDRPQYLHSLLDAGLNVHVFGPNWQKRTSMPLALRTARWGKRLLGLKPTPFDLPINHSGPPLSDEEMIRMYSRSKISLGFSTLAQNPKDGAPNKQVRLRDFEAPMSGAFYMVEFFEELAEFFEPDHEIVCFKSPEELVEKAYYYLSHTNERQQIRQAGLERARREHTWQKRFQMVFQKIGLKAT